MRLFILVIATFISGAAFSDNIHLKDEKYKPLLDSVFEFYEHEKRGEWNRIYEMRNSSFQKSITGDTFNKACLLESGLSRRESFKLVGAFEQEGKVYIKAQFVELLDRDRLEELGIESKDGRVQFNEILVWIEENGSWKCSSCGSRFKFSLYDSF